MGWTDAAAAARRQTGKKYSDQQRRLLRNNSELLAVPGKGCSAAEVSGRHHEPRLPRGCFPGPVRPYGVANTVGVQL
jgi:hypothetical protein